MSQDRISTTLLGRTVRLRDDMKQAPNEAWSARAIAGTRAEVVAVHPSSWDVGLVLTVAWEDDGTMEEVSVALVVLCSDSPGEISPSRRGRR